MNKIFQFSKENCPPCAVLKKLILQQKAINPDINYEYLTIEDKDSWDDEKKLVFDAAMSKGLRSLPIIAILSDDNIVYLQTENPALVRREGNLFDVLFDYFPEENPLIE